MFEVRQTLFSKEYSFFLVFDENLNIKNQLHCLFMKALGLYGKGEKEQSKKLFEKALGINPNTFQIATHYNLLF